MQAVFGGHCSTETLAIAPLSIRDQVPIFAVFVTAPKIENEGEWLFRNMSTNTYFGSVLADQAYKKGYRKVAVLTEEKDFPVSYSDEFISDFKKLGGTIALDERFTSDTNDYRTLALKLKAVDYDSIFISTQGSPTMGLIAKQINDLGLVKPMLFTHAFSYVNFTKASGGFLPKDMVVVESYADPNAPKVKKFDSSYVAKYGQIYNSINKFFIAADYDVAYRFKDAATGCVNDDNLDIDCVRAAFKSATSYSGVAGNIAISSKYSPDGIATPMGTLSVVDGKEVLSPIK